MNCITFPATESAVRGSIFGYEAAMVARLQDVISWNLEPRGPAGSLFLTTLWAMRYEVLKSLFVLAHR
jgi:hypothetical protein